MSFLYPPLEAAAAETTEVISLEDDDDEHDDGGVDKDKKNKVVVSGSSLSRDGSSYNTERKRFENRYYLSTSEAYSSWNQQYDNVMKLEDLDEQESDTTSIRAEKARRFQSISYMGRLGVPTPGDYLKRCAKQWKQEYREYKEIWQDPDTKKMDRYPQNEVDIRLLNASEQFFDQFRVRNYAALHAAGVVVLDGHVTSCVSKHPQTPNQGAHGLLPRHLPLLNHNNTAPAPDLKVVLWIINNPLASHWSLVAYFPEHQKQQQQHQQHKTPILYHYDPIAGDGKYLNLDCAIELLKKMNAADYLGPGYPQMFADTSEHEEEEEEDEEEEEEDEDQDKNPAPEPPRYKQLCVYPYTRKYAGMVESGQLQAHAFLKRIGQRNPSTQQKSVWECGYCVLSCMRLILDRALARVYDPPSEQDLATLAQDTHHVWTRELLRRELLAMHWIYDRDFYSLLPPLMSPLEAAAAASAATQDVRASLEHSKQVMFLDRITLFDMYLLKTRRALCSSVAAHLLRRSCPQWTSVFLLSPGKHTIPRYRVAHPDQLDDFGLHVIELLLTLDCQPSSPAASQMVLGFYQASQEEHSTLWVYFARTVYVYDFSTPNGRITRTENEFRELCTLLNLPAEDLQQNLEFQRVFVPLQALSVLESNILALLLAQHIVSVSHRPLEQREFESDFLAPLLVSYTCPKRKRAAPASHILLQTHANLLFDVVLRDKAVLEHYTVKVFEQTQSQQKEQQEQQQPKWFFTPFPLDAQEASSTVAALDAPLKHLVYRYNGAVDSTSCDPAAPRYLGPRHLLIDSLPLDQLIYGSAIENLLELLDLDPAFHLLHRSSSPAIVCYSNSIPLSELKLVCQSLADLEPQLLQQVASVCPERPLSRLGQLYQLSNLYKHYRFYDSEALSASLQQQQQQPETRKEDDQENTSRSYNAAYALCSSSPGAREMHVDPYEMSCILEAPITDQLVEALLASGTSSSSSSSKSLKLLCAHWFRILKPVPHLVTFGQQQQQQQQVVCGAPGSCPTAEALFKFMKTCIKRHYQSFKNLQRLVCSSSGSSSRSRDFVQDFVTKHILLYPIHLCTRESFDASIAIPLVSMRLYYHHLLAPINSSSSTSSWLMSRFRPQNRLAPLAGSSSPPPFVPIWRDSHLLLHPMHGVQACYWIFDDAASCTEIQPQVFTYMMNSILQESTSTRLCRLVPITSPIVHLVVGGSYTDNLAQILPNLAQILTIGV